MTCINWWRIGAGVFKSITEAKSTNGTEPCTLGRMSLTGNRPSACDCWFITGATASGKSRLGLVLAERLNAEIVSLDSMAVYRGLDIGTAKPSPEDQARLPHHLLDILDPADEYSLAQFVEA